ncbi:unnamed protein product [Penicillium roqueforti FM164]|uniref:Uncharacterized protein n=1 Tax=Penicillium roqueforti (strain FM164) TaxID=1365484 RepID=W6QQ61_PENRF|nr:unnamed protein product [Penicillium roqueforti FM164]
MARDKALVEKDRLEKELCQLQQESLNATMQDHISWNNIQPILHQTIEAFQSRIPELNFPGSGVIHGTWPGHDGPLGTSGYNTLPGFSASSGYPPIAQRTLAPTNQFGSLYEGKTIQGFRILLYRNRIVDFL